MASTCLPEVVRYNAVMAIGVHQMGRTGFCLAASLWLAATTGAMAGESVVRPEVVGDWWTIATNPDLGTYQGDKQQPVDFALWQAKDGTWQLWSCIRNTRCGGVSRLFHRWEGKRLTDVNWQPMGVAMEADPNFGETPGGLQAPYVVRIDGIYHMFYGDWENICCATSSDGKAFRRRVNPNRRTGLFTEGVRANTRDPMVLKIGGVWHCYYTAGTPQGVGAIFCRTSTDTLNWSLSRIVSIGGRAGKGFCSAECPQVVEPRAGHFVLFRTERYGRDAVTHVYESGDPLGFGIDSEAKYVCSLPLAAPEVVTCDGQDYLACLLPNLQGIRIGRLRWRERQ